MSCPTCQQTMQLVYDQQPLVHWCPNCGTLKTEGNVPEFERPRIGLALEAAMTHVEGEDEVDAVALLVERYHEVRREGQPACVIVCMPEAEPHRYIVVRFGGLAGGSAVRNFSTAREAAKYYLGVE